MRGKGVILQKKAGLKLQKRREEKRRKEKRREDLSLEKRRRKKKEEGQRSVRPMSRETTPSSITTKLYTSRYSRLLALSASGQCVVPALVQVSPPAGHKGVHPLPRVEEAA